MANEIQLNLSPAGKGFFFIEKDGERLAEMEISVSGNHLTVYHTEVSEKLRGHGVASLLLEKMVDYARQNHLKVIPLCPYVSAQFRRHPELYTDVWEKDWHK